jgi:hypothetical protein
MVPMNNANMDDGKLLTAHLTEQGTMQSFHALLLEALSQVQSWTPCPACRSTKS